MSNNYKDFFKHKKTTKLSEHCGECEDDFSNAAEGSDFLPDVADDYDDNGGLPKVGGALAVPHVGQPIMMGKIIQVGGEFKGGQPASGEQSGMTNCDGVSKDTGGLPVQQSNDKEPITAGGKPVDSSIASKSVGGSVVPGEGQKQGGPNSQGTIAATAKLAESKNKIRKIVKEVLKEIKYDKASGKWVRINEEVNMKMGASYKTVQPRQYKVMDDDFARTNQYEPEITEMYDDEEECMMNERYVELANEQRNLSEAELMELKTLREKIDHIQATRRNFGLSQGGVEPSLYEDDKWIQKAVNPKHKGYCTPMTKATCTPHRKAFAMRAKHHDLEETEVSENRCEDYPCCGHGDGGCPNSDGSFNCAFCGRKLPKGARSSMCDKCQQRMHDLDDNDPTGQDSEAAFGGGEYQMEETVDMKMGPSYKTVQPTLAKTSDDDFARTNQYDPQVSEAGGGAVQHSSYRTADHGNMPQDPEQRWENDLDEGESKVAKTIAKGQKAKKSTFSQSLKHQKPKKTSSGVHKRKP